MFNRRHDRLHPAEAGPAPALDTSDLKEAYRLGRKDERARRKRHPVLMTVLFLLALAGAAFLGLAAINGSFSDAGQVADHNLSVAADRAEPAIQGAAGEAADTLRSVGDGDEATPAPAAQPTS
jgi:hypothetical protein